MKSFLCILLAAFSLWASGCGSKHDSEGAVRQAIRDYLAARPDLSMGKMTVRVDSVDFEGDRATAHVAIMARDDSQARIQMVYRLKRSGSGWEVEPSSSGAVGGAHGMGGSAVPPEHPPVGETSEENRPPLPEGHPPVGENSEGPNSELPKGHPPVSPQ